MNNNFQSLNSAAQKSSQISPSEICILLWDIDGTLLQSTRPGSFRTYFAPALKKVYGTSGKIAEVSAAGATDLQIVFESLKDAGFTVGKIASRMNEFIETLCVEMQEYLDLNAENYEILPGVKKILQATEAHPRFVNALLTGNFQCGAEIKCRSVGVWNYFENSLNTYGDVSQDRRHLAVTAGKNFNNHYKFDFHPSQFLVIGDTIFDIAAAKHFGAKTLSVETGRGIERTQLKAKEPDFLIKDLSDTKKVLEIFESL